MSIDILALCYHGVSHSWTSDISLTPSAFETQLKTLVRAGYRGATLTQALTAPRSRRVLVVTFDDAYGLTLELAQPILSRLGLPATVFVPTDYVGTGKPMAWPGNEGWLGTDHEAEIVCASWPELRRLAVNGWEIGSHTRSHPQLTQIDDRQLTDELTSSRTICEHELGRPCISLAYPHSDEDDRVVEAARDAGYGLAVTVQESWRTPLPLRWPRMQVGAKDVPWRLLARVAQRRYGATYIAGSYGTTLARTLLSAKSGKQAR